MIPGMEIPNLSGSLVFSEAAELAYFGAKILHPASIWPAQHFIFLGKIIKYHATRCAGHFDRKRIDTECVKAIAAKDFITAIQIKSSRMLLAYGFFEKNI